MRRTPLALVVLVLALSLIASACSSSTDGVTTDEVRRATVTEVVDVPASVTAKAVATVSAPADGTIASLAVGPGVQVDKGAVVAVIDSPSAQKRLTDARAALATASRATGGFRGVDLSSAQRSLDAAAADAFAAARQAAGGISDVTVRDAFLAQVAAAEKQYASAAQASKRLQQQVQQGIASIGQAVSALGAAQKAQAQAAYDVAKSTVDSLTLRAPIAGVVQLARPTTAGAADPLAGLLAQVGAPAASAPTAGQANQVGVDDILGVGDLVSAGAPIVTIVDISEIGLVGEVDETDVLLVAPGTAADVELDAAPGLRFEATVGTVDLLPTQSARGGVAYRIRLSFRAVDPGRGDQPPPTPRPGMSAVAHLRVRTATDAIAVPAAAVFTTGQGDAVWLERDGKAVQQAVTVGVQGEDLVQILSGLQPGQRVVVSGTDKVTAGQDLT